MNAIEDPFDVIEKLIVTDKIEKLSTFQIVIESIHEAIEDKRQLFYQLEEVLSPTAIRAQKAPLRFR